jgi:hypothetical protein
LARSRIGTRDSEGSNPLSRPTFGPACSVAWEQTLYLSIELPHQFSAIRLDNMEIIQVVLGKKLLHATDQAARQTKRNRSALVRDALREHLRRLEARAREERDRQGYSTRPQRTAETDVWEAEAVWPAR